MTTPLLKKQQKSLDWKILINKAIIFGKKYGNGSPLLQIHTYAALE